MCGGGGRTTGLCQLSETCRYYSVLHNLGCLKDVDPDVLCSEECQTKKLLVCCKIFAFFFKAIFKFCTAKRVLRIKITNFYENYKYVAQPIY